MYRGRRPAHQAPPSRSQRQKPGSPTPRRPPSDAGLKVGDSSSPALGATPRWRGNLAARSPRPQGKPPNNRRENDETAGSGILGKSAEGSLYIWKNQWSTDRRVNSCIFSQSRTEAENTGIRSAKLSRGGSRATPLGARAPFQQSQRTRLENPIPALRHAGRRCGPNRARYGGFSTTAGRWRDLPLIAMSWRVD